MTRFQRSRPIFLLSLLAASSFVGIACDGSEVHRRIDPGEVAPPDVVDDTTDDADAASTPTVDFEFGLRTGAVGRGQVEVFLDPGEELAAYQAIAGFQTDVGFVVTDGGGAGIMRLLVDGAVIAQQPVPVASSAGEPQSGAIRGVGLPIQGSPFNVTLEFTRDGVLLAEAEKLVSTGTASPCVVELAVEGEACAATAIVDDALGTPNTAIGYTATLVSGDCDRLTGTVSLGDGTVLAEVDAAIPEGGVFEGVWLVGPASEPIEFDLTVALTAVHPVDSELNGRAELAIRVDGVAPDVSLSAPLAVPTSVIISSDDAAGALPGIQIAFEAETTAADAASATLSVEDAVVGDAVALAAPGPFTLPVATFDTDAEVSISVSVTDRCGNTGTARTLATVVTTPGIVVVVSPFEGANLLAVDDGDRTTANLYETDVVVAVAGLEGTPRLVVTCEGAEVGSADFAAPSADGRYAVPVILDVDTLGTETSCVAAVAGGASSAERAFRIGLPAPTLEVLAPADGTCVNTREVPVVLGGTGLDGAEVTWGADGASGDVGAMAAGIVAGVAELPDDQVDGPFSLSFDAVDGFGNRVSALGPAPMVTLRLDRSVPQLAFDVPATAVIDADAIPDADPDADGYQVRIGGTVTDSEVDGEVCLEGGACAAPAADGSWELLVTLTFGENVVETVATDACGNRGPSVTRILRLDRALDVAILTPAVGATLLAADDGDTATALLYETEFSLITSGVEVGDTLTVRCRADVEGSQPVDVGSVAVDTLASDGVYVVAVALPVDTLGQALQCRPVLSGANALEGSEIALAAALPAPSLVVIAPADGACVSAGTLAVTGEASSLEGRTVFLTLEGVEDVAEVADGTFGVSLDISVLADGGPYALLTSATDTFGNPATAGVGLSVDRSAPVFARIAPNLALDPSTAPDESPAPGYQKDIVIGVSDANAGGASVCLEVGGEALGCRTVDATQVTFPAVTLQPGDNAVTVTGADACGNAGDALAFTLDLQTDPPVVRIVAPANDLVTAATSADISAVSLESGTDLPVIGGVAVLLVDGEESAVSPTETADGEFTFAGVPLTPGATHSFVVEVTRELETGTSAPRLVRQKNVLPEIAITTPGAGLITLATTACTNNGPGCQLTATAGLTDVEDGSLAGLSVDCDGAAASFSATASEGIVAFTGVSLAEGATCTLVATVTDAAGQDASSEEVVVTVARTAPAVSFVDLLPIYQLNADVDPGTAGIQAGLRVSATGAAPGQALEVTFAWIEAGVPRTKTLSTVIESGITTYDLEEVQGSGVVTWPEGIVTVTATVADGVGNVGSAEATVTVNGVATVAITTPADTANTCTTTCVVGICHEGACWRGWGIGASRILSVNLTGLATTANNLRVCSDSPTLEAEGAPLCASAAGPSGPYRQVFLSNGTNGANILSVPSSLPVGYQRLIVESLPLSGGSWVTSANAVEPTQRGRRLLFDLTAPTVSGVSSPSDTEEPLGYLNIAEQESTPRVYSISFTASEQGRADIVVNGIIVRSENIDAGDHAFDVTLPEGQPSVWVIVTDSVGNSSPTTPGSGSVVYRPFVDVSAPTLSFTRPVSSPLGAASDRNVALSSNAEGNVVTVFDDGTQVGSGIVNGGSVTLPFDVLPILTDGEHRLTASVADIAGNVRTVSTTPALVVVDTVPPGLTVSAPTDGADLVDGDDAAPLSPGFQLDVLFGTSDGAISWTVLTAANCDDAFTTCDAPSQRANGSVSNAGGNEPAVRIDAPITEQVSRFLVIVRVLDAVGNATEVAHPVTVTSATCQAVFTNLPSGSFYNATFCDNATSCPSAVLEIGASTIGFCTADTIELLIDEAVVASSPLASFDGAFDVAVADGTTVDLRVRITLGVVEVASTATETRTADFSPPSVLFVAADVDGFPTTADGDSVTYAAGLDLEPGTAGMQLHAAFDLADVNAAGGFITALTATDGTVTVDLEPFDVGVPSELSGASPIRTELRELTLGDGATWTVTVAATDAAGNPGSSSFAALVDVTRPGAVAITDVVYDRRRPRLAPIGWTAVGDNGITGAPATDYVIRYSNQPIDAGNWDDACDFQDIYGSDAMPTPAAPGAAMEVSVGGPDSRDFADPCKFGLRFDDNENADDPALYVAVRAVDDAGNLSDLGGASSWTLTNDDVRLPMTRIRFDPEQGTLGFTPTSVGVSGADLGDINGDGTSDFGVGITVANAACVFLGHDIAAAGETIAEPSGTFHDCITPPDAATVIASADRIGDAVVPLGDVNADGRPDFGITGRRITGVIVNPNGTTTTQRDAFLLVYFGADSTSPPELTAPDLVIVGISPLSSGAGYLGACGLGNVDGVAGDELGIGEPAQNRLHVIPGRAAWGPAAGGAPVTIDLGAANGVEDAGGMTFALTFTSDAPAFGSRCGKAGDVLPTPAGQGGAGLGDFLVAQFGNENGRLFVFAGRTLTPGAVETVTQNVGATPTAEDQRSLRLRQEENGQQPNSIFGIDFQGGLDATGDGVPDILSIANNRSPAAGRDGKSIYLFDGAKLAGLVGGDVRIDIGANPLVAESWTGMNGWVFRSEISALFGATRLLPSLGGVTFGSPPFEPPYLLHSNSASNEIGLRLNHEDPPASYVLGQHPVYDGEAMSRFNAGTFSIGTFVIGGVDFTGDGLPDIIAGTNFGEILIIR